MKNSSLKKVTALFVALGTAVLLSANRAQAQSEPSDVGLFLEPGISYEFGRTTTDWPLFSNSTGESNGFGLTGRLGVHVADIFFVGIDARYSMPYFKDSSVNYSAEATQFNWGPVVGAQTPLYGIRVWGSYVAGGFLDPKSSRNIDVKLEDSTGYRLGAGVRYMMFSINLEYQNIQYGGLTVQSLGALDPSWTTSSVKPKNESWLVSVSFPFSI